MRNAIINSSLERTLSRDRLKKYLEAANGNLDAALGLYERNTRLSEALYTPLQGLEVCLRNSLNEAMAGAYGDRWLFDAAAPLKPHSRSAVQEAADRCGVRHSGPVIAEMKFSFWVGLVARPYDATLWRTCLHRAFRAQGPKARAAVHDRLNAIRRFRNRVAHHEPIFQKARQMHDEILEAIGWMCVDTRAWTANQSRFHVVVGGAARSDDA